MQNNIYILCDYKGFFESKQKSQIYRGGMDVEKIISYFKGEGFAVKKIQFSDLNNEVSFPNDAIFLYTSSEDNDGQYKSLIEDLVFHCEEKGFTFLPGYAYLKAHNNKVAMELLRSRTLLKEINTIDSKVFGTLEELKSNINKFQYPVVIKTYAGAMSRGVAKAENKKELIQKAKRISQSISWKHDIKELLRKVKYGNKYIRESFHRKKFVVQNMIQGLDSDWKILVYSNKCFALHRANRKNDFRASGSGNFLFREDLPDGMLDFAYKVKEHFDVPFISLDIGIDGKTFHLIEFQFLNFGTTTLEKSPHYFIKTNGGWQVKKEESELEKVYVESVVNYLKRKSSPE